MFYPPPPGFDSPKTARRSTRRSSENREPSFFKETVRGTMKLADGYNKTSRLHALAAIAQELRMLFRG